MKATKYIAALALMMGLVACQPEMFNGNTVVPEEESVAVVFSVQFPEPIPVATKGTMGEGPLASEAFDIHLCVYGSGDGYVQNWITATHLAKTTTTIGENTYITGGKFKTFLPVTDEKRTIHIIANPPAEVVPTTDDYLDNVMERMVTGKNEDTGQYEASYWQEIILEHGIHANQSGTIDTQSGLPMASPELIAEFNDIHLLRNFAKLIVEGPSGAPGDDEAIIVHKWTYINVPTKGYVAPYDAAGTSRFPSGYSNAYMQTVDVSTATGVKAWWNQLTVTDKYPGVMPNGDVLDTEFPGELDDAEEGVYVDDGDGKYMYERPKPTSSQVQTAVLVQVEFEPDHALYDNLGGEVTDPAILKAANTYWYKIEVLDDKGEYVPILRNFVYTLHIEGLTETGAVDPDTGEHTAEAAFNGPYFGNISASLETASLTDLSNGKSAIHASQLDFVYTSVPKDGGVIQPIQLMNSDGSAFQYYFVPNVQNGNAYVESNEYCTITIEVDDVAGFEEYPAVVDGSIVTDADGKLTFTPYDIDESHMRKSIIRIKGIATAEGSKELYREIMVTLMTTPSFTHVSPSGLMTKTAIISAHEATDIAGRDKPVELQICLPEGLGSSMFPIQIRIEAENNTLSATNPKLPVTTGKSYYDEDRNTFFYIYTINYSDYCSLNPRTKKYEYKYIYGGSTAPAAEKIVFYTNKGGDNSTKIHINDLANQFTPVDLTIGSVPEPPTPAPDPEP